MNRQMMDPEEDIKPNITDCPMIFKREPGADHDITNEAYTGKTSNDVSNIDLIHQQPSSSSALHVNHNANNPNLHCIHDIKPSSSQLLSSSTDKLNLKREDGNVSDDFSTDEDDDDSSNSGRSGTESDEEPAVNEDYDDDNDQYDDVEEEHVKPRNSGDLSTDDESEKCVICLNRFLGQTIGTPEVCNHNFCLECIEEWSRQVSACPVDRKIYSTILAKKDLDGPVIQRINVSADNQIRPAYDDVAPDDVTYCEVCGRCDREDRLLLCDGCDFGFHLECLNPPLEHVPIEDWYCPDCNRVSVNPTHMSTNLLNVIAHGISSEYSLIQRYRRRRMNPEGISEIVRTRINERRRTRLSNNQSESTSGINRIVYSAYSDNNNNDIESRRTTQVRSRSKKPTKRSTKRSTKRKSTKKKTTKKRGKSTRRKGSRFIKKNRRKLSKSSAVDISDSSRNRLARKLGIRNVKKTPFGLPVFRKDQKQTGCLAKANSSKDLTIQRENAGIARISLCGTEQTHNQPVPNPELYVNGYNQSDDIEYEHNVLSEAAAVAAITRRRMTAECAARILAKKASPSGAKTSSRSIVDCERNLKCDTVTSQTADYDVLGSILNSQTVLLTADQSITKDGELRVNSHSLSRSRLKSSNQLTDPSVKPHEYNPHSDRTEKRDYKSTVYSTEFQTANPNSKDNSHLETSNIKANSRVSTNGIPSTLNDREVGARIDTKKIDTDATRCRLENVDVSSKIKITEKDERNTIGQNVVKISLIKNVEIESGALTKEKGEILHHRGSNSIKNQDLSINRDCSDDCQNTACEERQRDRDKSHDACRQKSRSRSERGDISPDRPCKSQLEEERHRYKSESYHQNSSRKIDLDRRSQRDSSCRTDDRHDDFDRYMIPKKIMRFQVPAISRESHTSKIESSSYRPLIVTKQTESKNTSMRSDITTTDRTEVSTRTQSLFSPKKDILNLSDKCENSDLISLIETNSNIHVPKNSLIATSTSADQPVHSRSHEARLLEKVRTIQSIPDGNDDVDPMLVATNNILNLLNNARKNNCNFSGATKKFTAEVLDENKVGSNQVTCALEEKLCKQSLLNPYLVNFAKSGFDSELPRHAGVDVTDSNKYVSTSKSVNLSNKEKYYQKLNKQEKIADEVKLALKPHYMNREITKEEYKDILRRTVPQICHSNESEINSVNIRSVVETYIRKVQKARKN